MLAHIALAIVAGVLLDTPTPTPTPVPTPLSQPVSSFSVPPVQPPWDIPLLATWGTGTPIATLYASTPPHATDFPDQIGTATAQIDSFTGPIAAVSTPVAGLVGIAPTSDGSDIDTGLDPLGTGNVTLSLLSDHLNTDILEVVGVARAFVLGFMDLASYSTWLAPIMVMIVITATLDVWVGLVITLLKAISWLFNFVLKVANLIGIWVPK